jgi:hypothetical protein
MSDMSKFLPLSNRPQQDESAVTSDWQRLVAQTIAQLVPVLDSLSDEQWMSPSCRPKIPIATLVADLAWRLATPRRRQFLRHAPAAGSKTELSEALRSLAASGHKRHLRELAAAVTTTLDVARAVGAPVALDDTALGAVALARAASAPADIKAVLKIREIAASDAEWHFGVGKKITAPAALIVLFLYGRIPLSAVGAESPPSP